MKSVVYMGCILMAFTVMPPVLKHALGVSGGDAFGFTVFVVGIAVGGDIVRRIFSGDESKASRQEPQIRAELDELKRNVSEIREYVTDLYIQQHDRKASQKTDKAD